MSGDIVTVPDDPGNSAFAAYWTRKCRADRLPGRADLPVEELRPWLGRILIMEVIDGGRDFRYRLIGTTIVQGVGRDLTGRLMSECDYDIPREEVAESFRRPILARAPVFRRGRILWRADRSWRLYESVHCPLAADGVTIDMTIGVHAYTEPRRAG